jgi:hypothetical protein
VLCPDLLIESLSRPTVPDKYGNVWQYHSRSDKHSKVACWGIAIDLLLASNVLRRHAEDGRVVLGVNHRMRDFATGRAKRLDLVLARPDGPPGRATFADLAERFDIHLDKEQRRLLDSLPVLRIAPVGAVLVALEAKATMTAHIRALPRLYDELNSSHLCVHGASRQALAIGFVMINAASTFASSDRNKHDLGTNPLVVSKEPQPRSLLRTLEKVAEIPRRSNLRENGFDGMGAVVVHGHNDGSAYRLVNSAPAPRAGEAFHYDGMVTRMAHEYDTTFSGI